MDRNDRSVAYSTPLTYVCCPYASYFREKNIAINEYKSKAEKSVANLSKCNEKFNTNVTEEFKHILNII